MSTRHGTQLEHTQTDWCWMRIEPDAPQRLPTPASTAPPQSSFRSLVSSSRLSTGQARTLLGNAWAEVTGSSPGERTSALLTAHWAVETDAGRCMPGHNVAGIKATPGAAGKTFPTVEGHGATRLEIDARFRIYDSAEAGALDYVKLLATRYPDAVSAARAGDSAAFVRALAKGGYFTAAPEAYAAGLDWRLRSLEPGFPGHATPPQPSHDVLARAALDGLLHVLRSSPDDG